LFNNKRKKYPSFKENLNFTSHAQRLPHPLMKKGKEIKKKIQVTHTNTFTDCSRQLRKVMHTQAKKEEKFRLQQFALFFGSVLFCLQDFSKFIHEICKVLLIFFFGLWRFIRQTVCYFLLLMALLLLLRCDSS